MKAHKTYIGFKEIFMNIVMKQSNNAILFKQVGEKWHGLTGESHLHNVAALTHGLTTMGLRKGDQILILAKTSYTWQALEHACLLMGLEVIGLETHAKAEFIAQVVNQLKVKAVFMDDAKLAAQLPKKLSQSSCLKINTSELESMILEQSNDLILAAPTLSLKTPATIIFTSGTTGAPKGIRYTHQDLILAYQGILNSFSDINHNDRTLSWLPMANLFQRVLNLCAFAQGVSVYYLAQPQDLMKALPIVKPTLLIAVPRFFEKITKGIEAKISFVPAKLRSLIMSQLGHLIKRQMGGELKFFISGSAKCHTKYLNYFKKIGMPILEAYGMSESVMPIALNTTSSQKLGSVGKVLACNQVKISEQGEILLKTPTLACKYISSKNSLNIDRDGFLKTGDKGRLDAEGFLFIEGRLNDIVKTTTGRKLDLSELDRKFSNLPHADHVVAIAESLPAVCLILSGVKNDEATRVTIEVQIKKINESLPSHQQVRQAIFLEKPLSIEDGTLTNNLKVRRSVLAALCASLIAA